MGGDFPPSCCGNNGRLGGGARRRQGRRKALFATTKEASRRLLRLGALYDTTPTQWEYENDSLCPSRRIIYQSEEGEEKGGGKGKGKGLKGVSSSSSVPLAFFCEWVLSFGRASSPPPAIMDPPPASEPIWMFVCRAQTRAPKSLLGILHSTYILYVHTVLYYQQLLGACTRISETRKREGQNLVPLSLSLRVGKAPHQSFGSSCAPPPLLPTARQARASSCTVDLAKLHSCTTYTWYKQRKRGTCF